MLPQKPKGAFTKPQKFAASRGSLSAARQTPAHLYHPAEAPLASASASAARRLPVAHLPTAPMVPTAVCKPSHPSATPTSFAKALATSKNNLTPGLHPESFL